MITKTAIKNAGKVLRTSDLDDPEYSHAYDVLAEYRQAHDAVLRIVNMRCRKIIETHFIKKNRFQVDDFFIAQRLKRLESIVIKLERFQNMGLETMQDIGGIRVMLPSLQDVALFIGKFPGMRSNIQIKKTFDYITTPKEEGYRSYHYVLEVPNPKNESFPRLKVELQVRTKVQHAWATAVEVAGFMQKQSFKTGDWHEDWKVFFELSSKVLMLFENDDLFMNRNTSFKSSEILPQLTLISELKDYEKKGKFLQKLKHLNHSIRTVENWDTSKRIKGFYLIQEFEKQTNILPIFQGEAFPYEDYIKLKELDLQKNKTGQILKIEIDDIKKIKRAYPNFFGDITAFVHFLEHVISYKFKNIKLSDPNTGEVLFEYDENKDTES